MRLLLINGAVVALLLRVGVLVRADFGDYVDPTYNCPAQTTCPQICVAAVEECPTACDEDAGWTLCADGSCQAECGDDLENPCEFACAGVACAKQVTAYNTCKDEYGPLYEAETACGEAETAEEVKLFKYTEAGFVVVYAWVTIVSVLILAWCLYKYVPKMCAVRTSKTIARIVLSHTQPHHTAQHPALVLIFQSKDRPRLRLGAMDEYGGQERKHRRTADWVQDPSGRHGVARFDVDHLGGLDRPVGLVDDSGTWNDTMCAMAPHFAKWMTLTCGSVFVFSLLLLLLQLPTVLCTGRERKG
jgi:hypothetical protein